MTKPELLEALNKKHEPHKFVYKYVVEVQHLEHMLTAKEIAEKWGIYSSSRKPHQALINALFQEYSSNNDLIQLKFASRYLTNVYSKEVQDKAYRYFLELCKTSPKGTVVINDKTYYYALLSN